MERKNTRNVAYVFDLKDGKRHSASEYLGNHIDQKVQVALRHYLALAYNGEKPPRLRCYDCRKLLKVRKNSKTQGYHFWHVSNSCIHSGSDPLSRQRLNAIKYNGQKESEAHFKLKNRLVYYLEQMDEIESIRLEKHVVSDLLKHTYRKPDLNFVYKDLSIAMEVQLSTTWLDVILAREQFYRDNEMFVIWVFNTFQNDDTKRLAAFNDILYTNDSHAYLFDAEAETISEQNNRLYLKVYYREYFINDDEEKEHKYASELIDFAQIKFNREQYRHYYVNVDAQEKEIDKEVERLRQIWLNKRKIERLAREKKNKEAAERRDKIREKMRINQKVTQQVSDKLALYKRRKSVLEKTLRSIDSDIWSHEIKERRTENAYNDVVYCNDKLKFLNYGNISCLTTIIKNESKLEKIKVTIEDIKQQKDHKLSQDSSLIKLKRELKLFSDLKEKVVNDKVFKVIPFIENRDIILNEPHRFYFFDKSITTDLFTKPSIEKIETSFEANQCRHKLQSGHILVLYDPTLKVPGLLAKITSLESIIHQLNTEIEFKEEELIIEIKKAKDEIISELTLQKLGYFKLKEETKTHIGKIQDNIHSMESKLDELKKEAKALNKLLDET